MIEKILGTVLLACIMARNVLGFGVIENPFVLVCGSLVGLTYLIGSWWINKPDIKNARTIVVTLLYGLASSCFIFALIFHLHYFTGADEMTVLSGILLAFSITVDFIWSINSERVINKWTIWRFAILVGAVLILFITPKDKQISYTYRRYPDFLKFYEVNKTKMDFDDLRSEFFNDRVEP